MSPPTRARTVVRRALAAAVILGIPALFWWRINVRNHQTNNSILLQMYCAGLTEPPLRDVIARQWGLPLPEAYSGTIDKEDHWGHKVYYEANGAGFVLVSYGKDGKPDDADYGRFIGVEVRKESVCASVDSDVVFNEHGPVKACLK